MSLPEAADWSRRDFDVASICSAAADWSRNYVGYFGCFNVNDRMPRISVPLIDESQQREIQNMFNTFTKFTRREGSFFLAKQTPDTMGLQFDVSSK